MKTDKFSSYEHMIASARETIGTDVRNAIGWVATDGNRQPPDEAVVKANAESAALFFCETSEKFYPERSDETEEHIRGFIAEMVERILRPRSTVH